jgi:hypothetical protein
LLDLQQWRRPRTKNVDNQPYGLFEYAQLEALPRRPPYRHSTIGSWPSECCQSERCATGSAGTVRNNAIVVLSERYRQATARPLVMERYFEAGSRGQ